MLRRELWDHLGGFDEHLPACEDYDLWLRLAKISELQYLPKMWANFRFHEDSKTIRDDDRCWADMVRIHFRDGGHWLSVITIKYVIRKVLAPVVTARRRRRMRQAQEFD